MKTNLDRRNFLKTASAAGLGMAISPNFDLKEDLSNNKEQVSIAFIGTGGRGRGHLDFISSRKEVSVPAICDIDPDAAAKAQKILRDNGQGEAELYSDNEYSYRKMLERDDIDGVLIATPWNWHAPMSVDAMKAGKYVGVEVPAAVSLEGCWDLVNTHEETGTKLMFLENTNYDRETLAVMQMLRDGLFGTPVHATCGYRHELRERIAFGKGERTLDGGFRGDYRTTQNMKRNADLYPTHGIGPVAKWFNINRGNRFLNLVSVASKSVSMHEFIINHPEAGPDHPNAKIDWKVGDMVTTIVKTANGETIVIVYDVHLPRPYSRYYKLNGTKGVWNSRFDGRRIHIDGKSERHSWETGDAYDAYMKKYDHPLWKKYGEDAINAGHGGMDYFTDRTFIECVRQNANPPMDVYDAAAWSAITPLSEMSIAQGSMPMSFPDFTRSRWVDTKPVHGSSDMGFPLV